jgi:ribulose-5-phosphate 4-epimerase/fuculose-1-phosphate aldolase
MSHDEIGTLVVAARVLGKHHVTFGALGHISSRIADTETLYIRGKGPDEVGFEFTTRDDIITVDFDANMVDGPKGLQPPAEALMHIWLYKKNPALRAIVHVHSQYAQLLTACDKPILPFFAAGPMGHIGVADIPTYPRGTVIATDELAEDFANFLGARSMALHQGHGMTVLGSSVEDATVRALNLELTMETTYKAYLLGNPRTLVEADVEILRRSSGPERHYRGGSAPGEAGVLATWKYYCMVTDEDPGVEGSLADR